uniref:TIL domain-containing protein n=1 Tax=Anopheles atroparvus TaxID=41427 RepID=A0A182IVB3_ANOAO
MACRTFDLSSLVVVVVVVVAIVAVHAQTTASDVSAVNTAAPPPETTCSKVNEKYDSCGNGCGDLTCSNYYRNDIKCNRMCVAGCFCEGGYVRTRGGSCVPMYTCAGR